MPNWIAPAPKADVPFGVDCLLKIWQCEAAAAAPVVYTEMGVQGFSVGATSWGVTKEVHQVGSGDESTVIKRRGTWPVSITLLQGQGWDELATLKNIDFATDAMLPLHKENDFPDVICELQIRQEDGTHTGSIVVPDFIIEDIPFDLGLEDGTLTIGGYSKRFPFELASGKEMEYNVFTANGSAVDFILNSTPVKLYTATNLRELDYDKLYYVKEKASGASTGTLKRTGYSEATGTVTATTAPAASTLVQILTAFATV